MRGVSMVIFAALAAAGPAAAQTAADQNQLYMQQEALRQQTLAAERQSFTQQQAASTNAALSDLAAARASQPPRGAPASADRPFDAAAAAQADQLRILEDEASAQERDGKAPQKPAP